MRTVDAPRPGGAPPGAEGFQAPEAFSLDAGVRSTAEEIQRLIANDENPDVTVIESVLQRYNAGLITGIAGELQAKSSALQQEADGNGPWQWRVGDYFSGVKHWRSRGISEAASFIKGLLPQEQKSRE